MTCAGCGCRGCTSEAEESLPIRKVSWRLGRRDALRAAASGAGALLVSCLAMGPSAALARKSKQKHSFRPPTGAKKVGVLRHLSPGGALATVNPRTGSPAVVIRPSRGTKLEAYSAVCTHMGCTVKYSAAQHLLVCPCHGSVYDPAHGAAVLSGPAPYPLPALKVAVDPKGNIWLV